jgi:hypothetical protein
MTMYSVFQAPEIEGDDALPAVVAEKFSWFAAILPPVYALVHGLWLACVCYVAAAIALIFLSRVMGGDAAFWLYILFAIAVGFEAPALRRRKLERTGWLHRADVIASGEDIAALEALKLGKTV